MDVFRFLGRVAMATLVISAAADCKKSVPPKPDPSASASARSRATARTPPPIKSDPQAMKVYRLDVCYYGTLNLRVAREATLRACGGGPSEKKLPNFGVQPPAPPPAPSASAAASAASAKAPPGGSPRFRLRHPLRSRVAVPGGRWWGARRGARFDPIVRLPYERDTRACLAAMNLKDPPMPEMDTAVSAFANYASELANMLTKAAGYYQREEYKKDQFAQGKELDRKLRESFAKLDDLETALGNALTAWHKAHPVDAPRWTKARGSSRQRWTMRGRRWSWS